MDFYIYFATLAHATCLVWSACKNQATRLGILDRTSKEGLGGKNGARSMENHMSTLVVFRVQITGEPGEAQLP